MPALAASSASVAALASSPTLPSSSSSVFVDSFAGASAPKAVEGCPNGNPEVDVVFLAESASESLELPAPAPKPKPTGFPMLPLPGGFPKFPKLEIAEEGCAKGLELGGAANRFEPPKGDDTGAAVVEDGPNLKLEEESCLLLLNAEEARLSDEVPKVKGVAVVVVGVGVVVVFPISGSEDEGAVGGNLNGEDVAFPVMGIVGLKPPPLLVSPSLNADEPNAFVPKENELGGAGIAGGGLD